MAHRRAAARPKGSTRLDAARPALPRARNGAARAASAVGRDIRPCVINTPPRDVVVPRRDSEQAHLRRVALHTNLHLLPPSPIFLHVCRPVVAPSSQES